MEVSKYHFLYLYSTPFGHYIYVRRTLSIDTEQKRAKKKKMNGLLVQPIAWIRVQFTNVFFLNFWPNVLALHKQQMLEQIMRAA